MWSRKGGGVEKKSEVEGKDREISDHHIGGWTEVEKQANMCDCLLLTVG